MLQTNKTDKQTDMQTLLACFIKVYVLFTCLHVRDKTVHDTTGQTFTYTLHILMVDLI